MMCWFHPGTTPAICSTFRKARGRVTVRPPRVNYRVRLQDVGPAYGSVRSDRFHERDQGLVTASAWRRVDIALQPPRLGDADVPRADRDSRYANGLTNQRDDQRRYCNRERYPCHGECCRSDAEIPLVRD